ncbi:amine sulfotransferase-like [Centruroides vittatus]|uniref:amine sulfotransferase-like n=1 Tax=Centruroides vittatus TaxID=120091 RepID=UPI00351012CE
MAEEKSNTAIPYQIISDFKFPKSFISECITSTIQYKPRNDDIFLSTFPRCGTTWTQQILYLIFHKGIPPKDGKDFMLFSPYLEMMGIETANKVTPCVLKVHLPFHLTPYAPESKYVYVARNPKDCCISFYYFSTRTVGNVKITFDEFFEHFITGKIPYGDYFDHVLSWYNHRDDSNVLFLTYEEMKQDICAVVKKICVFLGAEYSELINDNEIMKNIVHFSSFDFMKNTTNENYNAIRLQKDKDLGKIHEIWEKRNVIDSKIVRKGEVGDWKNHFSASQNERMNELIQCRFGNTDLLHIWKDLL